MVEAKRSSKNCPAGTPELKCASIDKVWYKKYLVDKVIPVIKTKIKNGLGTAR
ncbi:hypothetical protein L914_06734 [Phytophthora nicotianae]|uniref:Uncharacterized protein n=1 Tax=Phytophthora nicotianae TaxID=4792 RepID=W2NM96_PHYNI|nr:hypothetical protein L914_06734 [Phytophthora nicotianae]